MGRHGGLFGCHSTWKGLQNLRSGTKLQFDPPPPREKENSAILKFHMSNGSSSTLTDIVFEVSIVEELRCRHLDTRRRVFAGPFAIRGTIVLDHGYTAYEITFEPDVRPRWHPLEIRTPNKDLLVHARGGYVSGPARVED